MLKLNIKARRRGGTTAVQGGEKAVPGGGGQDMRAWRKHQNDIH